MNQGLACPSCGTAISDPFCPQCGEQRPVAHGLSWRHYLEELVDALTHLDSKLLRSTWLLVRRPGLLSVDYLRGRRVPLVSPLRLFVFVSIVYFVSLTLLHAIPHPNAPNIQFNTFATPLAVQLHGNDFYAGYAAQQVEQKLQREHITYPALERRYDEKTAVLSKTLLFVLIPVIALLFGLLFFRKRRYLAEHLVIATHFWAFALVLIGILLPAVLVPANVSIGGAGAADRQGHQRRYSFIAAAAGVRRVPLPHAAADLCGERLVQRRGRAGALLVVLFLCLVIPLLSVRGNAANHLAALARRVRAALQRQAGILSNPPMYARSTSGTVTEPSAFW